MSIASVRFVDSSEGWAVGSEAASNAAKGTMRGVLVHTRDGGQSWDRVELQGEEPSFDRVQFTDRANGWLVGRKNIYRTEDGGKNWQVVLTIQIRNP